MVNRESASTRRRSSRAPPAGPGSARSGPCSCPRPAGACRKSGPAGGPRVEGQHGLLGAPRVRRVRLQAALGAPGLQTSHPRPLQDRDATLAGDAAQAARQPGGLDRRRVRHQQRRRARPARRRRAWTSAARRAPRAGRHARARRAPDGRIPVVGLRGEGVDAQVPCRYEPGVDIVAPRTTRRCRRPPRPPRAPGRAPAPRRSGAPGRAAVSHQPCTKPPFRPLGPAAADVLLEDGDPGAGRALGQEPGGPHAGVAATDDRDVGAASRASGRRGGDRPRRRAPRAATSFADRRVAAGLGRARHRRSAWHAGARGMPGRC